MQLTVRVLKLPQLPQLLQSLIPCLSCRQCVVDTLEGPGIIKSECPCCHRPAWKRDLHANHKKAAVMHHLQALLAACADSPSGAQCMHAAQGFINSALFHNVVDQLHGAALLAGSARYCMLCLLLHVGTATSSAGRQAATSGAAVASAGRTTAAGSPASAAAGDEQWPQDGAKQGLSEHLPAEAGQGGHHAAEAGKAGMDAEGQPQACSTQAAPVSPVRSQHEGESGSAVTTGLSGSRVMLPEDTAVAQAPGTQAVAGVTPAPGEAQLQEPITRNVHRICSIMCCRQAGA